MTLLKKVLGEYFLCFIIIFYLISDFLTKFGNQFNIYILSKTNVILKSLFLLLIIGKTIINRKNNVLAIYLCLASLFFFYTVAYLINCSYLEYLQNFKTFVWYCYPFFIIAFMSTLNNNDIANGINHFLNFLYIVMIIQLLAVIIGYIGNVSIFKSYLANNRLGFNGIFINVSQSTYIYILIIFIYYRKFITENKNIDLLFLAFTILLSLLLGTKAIILFNLLFLNYVIFIHIKKFAKILIAINITLFCSFLLFIVQNPLFINIYKEKGLLNMLTSLRYDLFINSFVPYITKNWTIVNYLFGGSHFYKNRTEFEIIDIFWFFGIFGFLLYFFMINQYLVKIKYFKSAPLLFLGIIICLSGSFFTSITSITLFIFLLIYSNRIRLNKL